MKLSITKTKNKEFLYVLKSFRENGKSTTKIVEKLGSMADLMKQKSLSRDEVITWANDYIAKLNTKKKNETLNIILKRSQSKIIEKDMQSLFNGGYLFLQDIFYDLKLNKICHEISKKYKFAYDLCDIVSKLIYTRILYPCSKLSSFTEAKRFIEQPKFDLHHIYRALDILALENDYIQATIYKNSVDVIKRNTNILYYDCTNFFFETEEASGLRQYGLSKEHRPNPLVQFGLFMDGNGIPLAFCVNPGNQNEQLSLKPLEKKIISDFKISKFIICTDAGLNSTENRQFNNFNNRSYIVTQSLKTLKKYLQDWALDPNDWKLSGATNENHLQAPTFNLNEIDEELHFNSVFYKERWIKENNIEQRLIISYSPKYKSYQSNIRATQIKRAEKKAQNAKSLKTTSPTDPKRFINEIHYTNAGEIASQSALNIDLNKIEKEAAYDELYAVCTTLDDNIEKIIAVNKRRWEIEESFRIMKSEFKSRPVYLSNDNRIEAHFLICYLSLVIFRILENKLANKYSASRIIKTLKDMNFQYYAGDGYVPVYTRTDFTDLLHQSFSFRTDYEILSNKNIKKIIKMTKE